MHLLALLRGEVTWSHKAPVTYLEAPVQRGVLALAGSPSAVFRGRGSPPRACRPSRFCSGSCALHVGESAQSLESGCGVSGCTPLSLRPPFLIHFFIRFGFQIVHLNGSQSAQRRRRSFVEFLREFPVPRSRIEALRTDHEHWDEGGQSPSGLKEQSALLVPGTGPHLP